MCVCVCVCLCLCVCVCVCVSVLLCCISGAIAAADRCVLARLGSPRPDHTSCTLCSGETCCLGTCLRHSADTTKGRAGSNRKKSLCVCVCVCLSVCLCLCVHVCVCAMCSHARSEEVLETDTLGGVTLTRAACSALCIRVDASEVEVLSFTTKQIQAVLANVRPGAEERRQEKRGMVSER